MSERRTEELEAEIVRKVYVHGYAHAESILHRLVDYQRRMPHREAVARLHQEVMDE